MNLEHFFYVENTIILMYFILITSKINLTGNKKKLFRKFSVHFDPIFLSNLLYLILPSIYMHYILSFDIFSHKVFPKFSRNAYKFSLQLWFCHDNEKTIEYINQSLKNFKYRIIILGLTDAMILNIYTFL